MSEKSNEIIYELLKEIKHDVKEDLKEIHQEVTKLSNEQIIFKGIASENKDKLQEIATDLSKVKDENIIQSKDIEANKDSLIEHMDNNKLLRELIDLNERKQNHQIDELKKPKIARDYIIKIAGGIGVLSGAAYGVYRIILLF